MLYGLICFFTTIDKKEVDLRQNVIKLHLKKRNAYSSKTTTKKDHINKIITWLYLQVPLNATRLRLLDVKCGFC